MERELPPPRRAGLQACPLPGLLAQLQLGPPSPADRPAAPPSPPSFVEGLGRWLGWKQAIALSAVLQAAPGAATPSRAPTPGVDAWEREFQRVQQSLLQALADDSATAGEDGHSFLPFRRRCFSLQQAMDAATGSLRAQLRAAVSRLSPGLAQLAALDAAMAGALAPREQAQLALMPALLEKHFNRLRQDAADTLPAGAWLARFRQDMRALLRAELDLRLQPALGLLATLQQAAPTQGAPAQERP